MSRAWTASPGGGTDIGHTEVNAGAPGGQVAHGVKFLGGGGQGCLDRGDLAEPALFPCFLEPVAQVGVNLLQPGHLGWVDPEEGASDTCIFMRTWGAEIAAAGPRATFRSSKCARNSSHSVAVRSRYSSPGRSDRRRAMSLRQGNLRRLGGPRAEIVYSTKEVRSALLYLSRLLLTALLAGR